LAVKDILQALQTAKQFAGLAKCGGTKPCRGRSPNTVFWSLAAVRRRTFTALLCAVLLFLSC